MTTTTRNKRPMTVHIRWMIRRDMPAVLRVERDSGGTWEEDRFESDLRKRNCIGMVAVGRDQSDVLGFVIFDLNRDHMDVKKLAVHPKYRDRGGHGGDHGGDWSVGLALVRKMFDKLEGHRRRHIKFRPQPGQSWAPAVDPTWLSETVRLMAKADEPPDLGVLADALQEAGCGDDTLLGVLREGGGVAGVVYEAVRGELVGE
jgi:hypothetical protein